MNTYYELTAIIDGETEVLFGSFNKNDCFYEHKAEAYSLRDEGYRNFKVVSRETTDAPDPTIYTAEEIKEMI
jgi:hypothetical protein